MVPTCYGRQAILYEFGGLRMCSTSASIDSNRVVDVKRCCFSLCLTYLYFTVFWMLAYRTTSPVADKYSSAIES